MSFLEIISWLRDLIWSLPVLLVLLAYALYLTVKLEFIQFRYLGYALRLAFFQRQEKGDLKGEISHFQALMTSLAAAVGTGNIAGVATAITLGGFGAVVWLWIFSLLGMAIKYAEALLAIMYRSQNQDGEVVGGPMYYLRDGASLPKFAKAFAFFAVIATIGTGNMVQANSVADALHTWVGADPLWVGVVLSLVTFIVLMGGIKSIAKVTERFVPAMAIFYGLVCLLILACHWREVPEAFALIIRSAFCGQAASGGFLGASVMSALRFGTARAVFSTETAIGTSSIAAAAARTSTAAVQALVSMTSSFISAIVVCTMTALVLAVTHVQGLVNGQGELVTGAGLAIHAFESGLPFPGGSFVVSFGLVLFAYSTILAWAYYGEKCLEFLTQGRYILAYRLLYGVAVCAGALLKLDLVWAIADLTNGMMLIPNVFGLMILTPQVVRTTKNFLAELPQI